MYYMLKKYVTDLKKEFSGYNGKRLSADLMSGITVAAVALPLALAMILLRIGPGPTKTCETKSFSGSML